MQESNKPEGRIVLNVNKHSNYAAAAKFQLKEETFAEEFIKWMRFSSFTYPAALL